MVIRFISLTQVRQLILDRRDDTPDGPLAGHDADDQPALGVDGHVVPGVALAIIGRIIRVAVLLPSWRRRTTSHRTAPRESEGRPTRRGGRGRARRPGSNGRRCRGSCCKAGGLTDAHPRRCVLGTDSTFSGGREVEGASFRSENRALQARHQSMRRSLCARIGRCGEISGPRLPCSGHREFRQQKREMSSMSRPRRCDPQGKGRLRHLLGIHDRSGKGSAIESRATGNVRSRWCRKRQVLPESLNHGVALEAPPPPLSRAGTRHGLILPRGISPRGRRP